ncbi:helix-turn-helix domain-containing protein [Clostridium chromiireducens]|uniref:Helix-turn-helix domain-containing protein n=1 Tax=Clostridium chromiireducens TaxID=225345 RepID=A0A964RQB2_9CLOT|nr:helix-turn-helix transcriptional regulator [Clostridium chromiireducens]MVX65911.1 helix-turn-helix domain-containing protein [Clostridium chromiireducens]
MLTQIEIGTRIKQIRESKGISQQSLVNELNEIGMSLSRETLSKIENGNRTLAVHELKGICKALDVDVEVLLREEEDEVTLKKLFRKQNLQEDTLKKIDVIEDMIINFISQKNLPKKEKRNVKPLWRS